MIILLMWFTYETSSTEYKLKMTAVRFNLYPLFHQRITMGCFYQLIQLLFSNHTFNGQIAELVNVEWKN